jgi:uncharacterized protein YjbI with pentapeptide repeats
MSKAILAKCHFKGIDLTGANAEGADLSGAYVIDGHFALKGANLRGAILRSCRPSLLEGADLTGADCDSVDFGAADFTGVTLEGARLTEANLSKVTHLRAEQLIGCDLTNAELPDEVKGFDALKRAEETIKVARPVFLGLLGAVAYCWLTVAQTTDVVLLLDSVGRPLPIIQAEVKARLFFMVTPFILAVMNIYLCFYCDALWRDLSTLPARFPDGKPLTEKVHPWVAANIALWRTRAAGSVCTRVNQFGAVMSGITLWWLVPFTICLMLLRLVPLRDTRLLAMVGVALALSAVCNAYFGVMAIQRLRERPRSPAARFALLTVILPVAGALLFGMATGGEAWRADFDLRKADISAKPPSWDGKSLDLVVGAGLSRTNLKGAWAYSSFWAKSNLSNADLSNAILIESDFRGANLSGAILGSSYLYDALLQGADIRSADLRGALLVDAHFEGADLRRARFTGADVRNANFTYACLHGADLRDVEGLTQEQLTNASGDDKTQLDPPLTIPRGNCRAR